jgi:hypothetical protein
MASRAERRSAPGIPEPHEWQERYEDLSQRYDDLRRSAEEVVRDNHAMRNETSIPGQHFAGAFQVLLAVMILGRLALFEFVQHGGTTANLLGVFLTLLFLGGTLVILSVWARIVWEEFQWLAVVNYVLVIVMGLISLSVLDDGALFRGEFRADAIHPILAALIAVLTCLLAASPLAILVVSGIWDALANIFKDGGK